MTEPATKDSFRVVHYRGKQFTIPVFSTEEPIVFTPDAALNTVAIDKGSPVIQMLNTDWDLRNFKTPRRPVSLGILPLDEQVLMAASLGAPRTLDLPIKFPGSNIMRIPRALAQAAPSCRRAANFALAANPQGYFNAYCYLTFDQGIVQPGMLQREAPCHVDGFQGARWKPKKRNNFSFTVSNVVPTAYYIQPFDFDELDEAVHNFFWEMNRQVALTNSEFAWQPEEYELTLMDCYSVHRGMPVPGNIPLFRTFERISFEERIFDRLGNAHNPLFDYDWEMVPRDIEELNLVAFDPTCDPSLRVFPHQDADGKPLPKGQKTQPKLK